MVLTGFAVCRGAEQLEPVAVHDTSVNPFIVPQGGLESFGDPFPTYRDGVWHLSMVNGVRSIFSFFRLSPSGDLASLTTWQDLYELNSPGRSTI